MESKEKQHRGTSLKSMNRDADIEKGLMDCGGRRGWDDWAE